MNVNEFVRSRKLILYVPELYTSHIRMKAIVFTYAKEFYFSFNSHDLYIKDEQCELSKKLFICKYHNFQENADVIKYEYDMAIKALN